MQNKELFIEIINIDRTIKNTIIAMAIFGFALVGLIPIFRNTQNAGEIIICGVVFLYLWTSIFTKKLENKKKKLRKQLHQSGLSYLEINQTITKLKNSKGGYTYGKIK